MANKKTTKKAPRKVPPTKGAKKAPPKKPVAKNGKKPVPKKPVPKKPAKKTGPKANADKAPQKKKTGGTLPAGKKADGGLVTLGSKGTSKSVLAALLSLGQIVVKKGFNPRTSGVGDISSLTANIKAEGLLSALVVRPTSTPSKFSLVAGERRLRAMQEAGYKGDIPVIIRTDLVDDDDRAKAVALAENSEDGRCNLNPVEIGRVVVQLSASGWQTSRIAKETGLDHKKVQRCLRLMTIDVSVRKKVEAGEIGMIAGLEFAKLDEKTRKAVADEITSGTSAADVRRLRKNAENKASSEAAADAAETDKDGKGKKTKKPKVSPTAWRGSREKQALLREVSYDLVQMQKEKTDPMDYDFIESRALAIALLWDRGDLDTVEVPPENTDVAKEKKALVIFWKKINEAASLYEPPADAEVDVEEAGEPEEATVS